LHRVRSERIDSPQRRPNHATTAHEKFVAGKSLQRRAGTEGSRATSAGPLNKIIDAIANNELKVSVDAIDEKTLVVGFQKVANRITVG